MFSFSWCSPDGYILGKEQALLIIGSVYIFAVSCDVIAFPPVVWVENLTLIVFLTVLYTAFHQ